MYVLMVAVVLFTAPDYLARAWEEALRVPDSGIKDELLSDVTKGKRTKEPLDEVVQRLAAETDATRYEDQWRMAICDFALAGDAAAVKLLSALHPPNKENLFGPEMHGAIYQYPYPERARIASALAPFADEPCGLYTALHCIVEGLLDSGELEAAQKNYAALNKGARVAHHLQRRMILESRLPISFRETCFAELKRDYGLRDRPYANTYAMYSLVDATRAIEGPEEGKRLCRRFAASLSTEDLPIVLLHATTAVPEFTCIFLGQEKARPVYQRETFSFYLRLFRLNREGEFRLASDIQGELKPLRDLLADARTGQTENIQRRLAANERWDDFLELEVLAELFVRWFERGNDELAARIFEKFIDELISCRNPITLSSDRATPECWEDPGLFGPFYGGAQLITEPGRVCERLIARIPASVSSERIAKLIETFSKPLLKSRAYLALSARK